MSKPKRSPYINRVGIARLSGNQPTKRITALVFVEYRDGEAIRWRTVETIVRRIDHR